MDSRLIKPKSLLLKDYLLDDFSSCSSSGFKSFPRRQCCTTVRFLLEIDLKKNKQKKYLNFNKKNPPTIVKNKNKSKSPLSAFQSVITAMKRLPFAAVSSPEKKKSKKSFLPRSFSKKLLESGFWKRKSNRKEIQGWKSFDELLKEDVDRVMTRSESKSNSWSGSDFTVSTDESWSGNSSSEVNLNIPEGRNDDVEVSRKEVVNVSSKTVVVTNGDVLRNSTTSSDGSSSSTNSSTNTKTLKQKEWSNEEKEQFSPVSVLDCPFDDEDEISSSPFQHRLARMEGTKKKLMKKIQRFECLANELEPVNLSKRFVLQPQTDSDNESNGSPLPLSSVSIDDKFISDMEEEEEEEMAFELLHQMKNTLPSYGLKLNAENLLLDFFREKIVERKVACPKQSQGGCSFDEEVIDEAEEWINGRKRSQLLLGWEVQKNRQVYIKEMEKGKLEWKTLDQENEEVALELETAVFATLLDEVLLEVMPKFTSVGGS